MTDDERPTDPHQLSPEEDPMPKAERAALTTDQKFDAILDRLDRIDTDWTIAMNFLHEVALERGRDDIATRVNEALHERRPNGGADFRDEPTNPGADG